MLRLRWVVALVVWTSMTIPQAWAQKRVALVIGNSAYQHTAKLDNPKNDATDMAAALKKIGFRVIEGIDLDKTAFERKVRDFSAALRGAEVGLFFYAGHGLQVAGHNYLVPTDAKAEAADALDWEMVRLDLVHRTMERATSTNLIFLDACRDNPLARNLARGMGTRSVEIGHGLAAVESGIGTLISFSTQPGNVALDGTGRNSPFAGALVKRIATSTDDLSALLIDVRNDVRKETQNAQVPWEHSALTGRFYFNQPKAVPSSPAASSRQSEAAEAWNAAERTTSIPALEAFIARFNDTYYADLARARIEELKRQQIAVASPPAPPKAAPSKPQPGVTVIDLKLGKLKLEGEPKDLHYVYNAEGKRVAEFLMFRNEVELPAGLYSMSIANGPWTGIEVKSGETTVLRPGFVELGFFDSFLGNHAHLIEPKTRKEIEEFVPYNRPRIMVFPGRYDIMFWEMTLPGGIEVKAGEKTTIRLGVIRVQSERGFDFTVRDVHGRRAARHHTTVGLAPGWVALPPGTYELELELSVLPEAQRKMQIEVKAGEKLEIKLN